MNKVFIVAAKRTAVGSFLGTLKNVHPPYLFASFLHEKLSLDETSRRILDPAI